nr:MAG TPA: hypothetical protein [Caudoviricetes sp.]
MIILVPEQIFPCDSEEYTPQLLFKRLRLIQFCVGVLIFILAE